MIHVEGLEKTFGEFTAVAGISYGPKTGSA
jgi:hypothetical protein